MKKVLPALALLLTVMMRSSILHFREMGLRVTRSRVRTVWRG